MAALAANAGLKINAPVMQPMKTSVIKSGLFHGFIILIFTVGLPFVSKDTTIISAPIIVELVNISDVTATPRIAPPEKPKEKEKPPEEPVKKIDTPPPMKSEAPPDLTKPEPPDVKTAEKLPEPTPPKPLERTPIKKPEPPKPKPETTKTVEPKPKEDDFQSLLRNIIPDAQKPVEGEEKAKAEAKPEEGAIAPLGQTLSISEKDAIGMQLWPCWNPPIGGKNAESQIVELRIYMNRAGVITKTEVLDQLKYNNDTHFRAAADSARRATQNPRCSPIKFPPEKYDQLQKFIFNFDPRDML